MSATLASLGCSDLQPAELECLNSIEISGIYIGMPDVDVLRHLDEPESRNKIEEKFDSFIYPGLTVSLTASDDFPDGPKVVWGVWARSPEHCLRRTICPNSTLLSIRKSLGEPNEIQSGGRHYSQVLVFHLPDLDPCWIEIFTEDRQTASDVRISCQP